MDFSKMNRKEIETHLKTLSAKEIIESCSSYLRIQDLKLKRKSLIVKRTTNALCNFNGTMNIGK
jgi:hypothetical protein